MLLLLGLFSVMAAVSADTPANCTFDDLLGKWNMYFGPVGTRDNVNCTVKPSHIERVIPFTFSPINTVVKDTDGESGNFTLIYNQGFEFEVGHQKLFTFFEWEKVNASYSKYWCNRTMFGWAHDVLGREWSCFVAVKQSDKFVYDHRYKKEDFAPTAVVTPPEYLGVLEQKFVNDKAFINQLNKAQSSWKAVEYPHLETYTNGEVLKMAGHRAGRPSVPKFPKKPVDFDTWREIRNLPDSFDWRDVNGVNYVSPIRNQGNCGSCYSFASAAMLEARIRIMTNNSQTPVFSPQEVVSCGIYSQGCDGGFPYLVAGKYAQDFGLIEEDCYPYQGKDSDCKPVKPNCRRHYVESYRYIGGYYGGCSEDLMKLSLVKNGPIAVGFEVYNDFMQYKSGVYHHVFNVSSSLTNGVGYNPFELTNHAVLVVGYGTDADTKEPYWIVKNSWGPQWGEKGFFRIRRGNDECAIESLAQESFPVTDL